MNGVMLIEDALKIVARNIEDYYRKKAPNGAWCISTVLGAAEQFAAMREEVAALKSENDQLKEIIRMVDGACGYCRYCDSDGNSDSGSDFCNSCIEGENNNWQLRGLEGNHEQN